VELARTGNTELSNKQSTMFPSQMLERFLKSVQKRMFFACRKTVFSWILEPQSETEQLGWRDLIDCLTYAVIVR